MPMIGNKYYANPAYGRSLEDAFEDDAVRSTGGGPGDPGELKHIEVHPSRDGGFHVNAHHRHPEFGHHVVHSHHPDHQSASESVRRHLHRHQATHRGA